MLRKKPAFIFALFHQFHHAPFPAKQTAYAFTVRAAGSSSRTAAIYSCHQWRIAENINRSVFTELLIGILHLDVLPRLGLAINVKHCASVRFENAKMLPRMAIQVSDLMFFEARLGRLLKQCIQEGYENSTLSRTGV